MECEKGEGYEIYRGDCLEILDDLASEGRAVDCVICDPPFGITGNAWDSVIDFLRLWDLLGRLCVREDDPIVLFACGDFTRLLWQSNPARMRYRWFWKKNAPGMSFVNSARRPLRYLEEILVFSSGPKSPRYYPQMSALDSPRKARMCTSSRANLHAGGMTRGGEVYEIRESPPSEIIEFPVVNRTGILHPTQKPLDLMRYLVRTYSRSGETVLDFSMGSGTTGHAAILEKRRFIGIEIEQEYYDVAFQRLDLARHGCESENAHSLEEADNNPLFD